MENGRDQLLMNGLVCVGRLAFRFVVNGRRPWEGATFGGETLSGSHEEHTQFREFTQFAIGVRASRFARELRFTIKQRNRLAFDRRLPTGFAGTKSLSFSFKRNAVCVCVRDASKTAVCACLI